MPRTFSLGQTKVKEMGLKAKDIVIKAKPKATGPLLFVFEALRGRSQVLEEASLRCSLLTMCIDYYLCSKYSESWELHERIVYGKKLTP